MAVSSIHNGWRNSAANSRLDFYYKGTRSGHINATAAAFTGTVSAAGDFTSTTSTDSAAVADEVSIGRYEIGAANTVLAISQETAVAADVDETKFSHKMQVRINGSTYYVMLTAT